MGRVRRGGYIFILVDWRSHATIRKADKISPSAKFDRLEIEDWTLGGFFIPLRQRADRRSLVVVCAQAAA